MFHSLTVIVPMRRIAESVMAANNVKVICHAKGELDKVGAFCKNRMCDYDKLCVNIEQKIMSPTLLFPRGETRRVVIVQTVMPVMTF